MEYVGSKGLKFPMGISKQQLCSIIPRNWRDRFQISYFFFRKCSKNKQFLHLKIYRIWKIFTSGKTVIQHNKSRYFLIYTHMDLIDFVQDVLFRNGTLKHGHCTKFSEIAVHGRIQLLAFFSHLWSLYCCRKACHKQHFHCHISRSTTLIYHSGRTYLLVRWGFYSTGYHLWSLRLPIPAYTDQPVSDRSLRERKVAPFAVIVDENLAWNEQ